MGDGAKRNFRAEISAEAGTRECFEKRHPAAQQHADEIACGDNVKAGEQRDRQAQPDSPLQSFIWPDGSEERREERVGQPGSRRPHKLRGDVCHPAAQDNHRIRGLRNLSLMNWPGAVLRHKYIRMMTTNREERRKLDGRE